ncbi:hypothetical protein Y1Q_0021169 [Alligator mississippiensis]|uniref:Uncharacterized protein n=1 Tax=Alligator mississippiensis TaxID=8496 RepID=A0A151N075_ALLMI|nr:hypothetical protein Y1Q_0021169 [Alligator mississippiensis]
MPPAAGGGDQWPLLGAVLLLLASSVLSKGGRRCSVVEILRQYQAVLFDEIHNLKNLSGPSEAHRKHRSRAGPACRSNQEQKILLSIYNMSMSLWAAASGSLHDSRELAAMKVASNTESVIRQHCRKIHKPWTCAITSGKKKRKSFANQISSRVDPHASF